MSLSKPWEYDVRPTSQVVKTIVVEKIVADDTGRPRGEVFQWTYKTATHMGARAKVSEILKRRGENMHNWKEIQ
jgi:hypothetical protein